MFHHGTLHLYETQRPKLHLNSHWLKKLVDAFQGDASLHFVSVLLFSSSGSLQYIPTKDRSEQIFVDLNIFKSKNILCG